MSAAEQLGEQGSMAGLPPLHLVVEATQGQMNGGDFDPTAVVVSPDSVVETIVEEEQAAAPSLLSEEDRSGLFSLLNATELPEGMKRNFHVAKSEQLDGIKAEAAKKLAADEAARDKLAQAQAAVEAAEQQVAQEAEQSRAKAEEALYAEELERVRTEAFNAAIAKEQAAIEAERSILPGTAKVHKYYGEQNAQSQARKAAEAAVSTRKAEIEAAGGPTKISTILRTEAEAVQKAAAAEQAIRDADAKRQAKNTARREARRFKAMITAPSSKTTEREEPRPRPEWAKIEYNPKTDGPYDQWMSTPPRERLAMRNAQAEAAAKREATNARRRAARAARRQQVSTPEDPSVSLANPEASPVDDSAEFEATLAKATIEELRAMTDDLAKQARAAFAAGDQDEADRLSGQAYDVLFSLEEKSGGWKRDHRIKVFGMFDQFVSGIAPVPAAPARPEAAPVVRERQTVRRPVSRPVAAAPRPVEAPTPVAPVETIQPKTREQEILEVQTVLDATVALALRLGAGGNFPGALLAGEAASALLVKRFELGVSDGAGGVREFTDDEKYAIQARLDARLGVPPHVTVPNPVVEAGDPTIRIETVPGPEQTPGQVSAQKLSELVDALVVANQDIKKNAVLIGKLKRDIPKAVAAYCKIKGLHGKARDAQFARVRARIQESTKTPSVPSMSVRERFPNAKMRMQALRNVNLGDALGSSESHGEMSTKRQAIIGAVALTAMGFAMRRGVLFAAPGFLAMKPTKKKSS